jgi:hypothetical protein
LPELWDPIAGNYRAEDGWIRLHTNYPYHRAAVERVLGADDRAAVAAAALRWLGRSLARPPRVRQPGADVVRDRGRRFVGGGP